MSTAELLQQAVRSHQAGQLAHAGELYRRILAVNPRHPAALHLLGVIAHQTGQSDTAIDYISQAIRLDGRQAVYHCNLGEAYRAQRRFAAARACYERALELSPDLQAAHHNLGIVLQALGELDLARQAYLEAIRLLPTDAEAHNN